MTDPNFDVIRDALHHEAGTFSPSHPRDQAREQLLGRLHRRRRRDRLVLGGGILAVLLAAGVAVPQFLSSDVGGGREVRTVGNQVLDVASDGSGGAAPSQGNVGSGVPVTEGSTAVSIPVSTIGRSPVGTVAPPETLVTSPPGGSTPVATTVGPAPTASPPPSVSATGSGIAGRLVRDAGCPARTDPPQAGCSAGPAQGAIQVLRPDGGSAGSAQTASDGSFRIDLAPGHYVVQAAAGSGCAAAPVRVIVDSGRHVPVTLTCDSGVR